MLGIRRVYLTDAVSTTRWSDPVLMLGHHLRRWPNIKTTLVLGGGGGVRSIERSVQYTACVCLEHVPPSGPVTLPSGRSPSLSATSLVIRNVPLFYRWISRVSFLHSSAIVPRHTLFDHLSVCLQWTSNVIVKGLSENMLTRVTFFQVWPRPSSWYNNLKKTCSKKLTTLQSNWRHNSKWPPICHNFTKCN